MVLEDPEVPVDPEVDAGRLHHRRIERVDLDPAQFDGGAYGAI